jgi:hypothetical protein
MPPLRRSIPKRRRSSKKRKSSKVKRSPKRVLVRYRATNDDEPVTDIHDLYDDVILETFVQILMTFDIKSVQAWLNIFPRFDYDDDLWKYALKEIGLRYPGIVDDMTAALEEKKGNEVWLDIANAFRKCGTYPCPQTPSEWLKVVKKHQKKIRKLALEFANNKGDTIPDKWRVVTNIMPPNGIYVYVPVYVPVNAYGTSTFKIHVVIQVTLNGNVTIRKHDGKVLTYGEKEKVIYNSVDEVLMNNYFNPPHQ